MHFNNFFLLSPHRGRRDPSLKDALCHVRLKLIQWFWKTRNLNMGQICVLIISNSSNLHYPRCFTSSCSGAAELLKVIKYLKNFAFILLPLANVWFLYLYILISLVEISPMILEKKSTIWKVYRRKDRQTDERQIIRSFQRRQAIKKLYKYYKPSANQDTE